MGVLPRGRRGGRDEEAPYDILDSPFRDVAPGEARMRWIVIDGIDGSGKSTVARWMEEHYRERGERVLVQVHPSERRLGRLARRCLQGEERLMYPLASLFFLADLLVSLSLLRRRSRDHDVVIFVRYLMAAAYLPGRLAGIGYAVLSRTLPAPSRLLLVDVDPATALQRIATRRDEEEMFENLSALTRVRAVTLALSEGWTVLDNSGDQEASSARLEAIVKEWKDPEPSAR